MLRKEGGAENHTTVIERHGCSELIMREGKPKTKLFRVSMLARKASGKRPAILPLGQYHVIQVLPTVRTVVFCCVGGSQCWRGWFAISVELGSSDLYATDLTELHPPGSTLFPQRTNLFCVPKGSKLPAFIKGSKASDAAIRDVLGQFGHFQDAVAAKSTAKPLADQIRRARSYRPRNDPRGHQVSCRRPLWIRVARPWQPWTSNYQASLR